VKDELAEGMKVKEPARGRKHIEQVANVLALALGERAGTVVHVPTIPAGII
jgi:hypothetical protein